MVLEIAARLGRHRATIHRELKRNRFVDAELQELSVYNAMTVQSICLGRGRCAALTSQQLKCGLR